MIENRTAELLEFPLTENQKANLESMAESEKIIYLLLIWTEHNSLKAQVLKKKIDLTNMQTIMFLAYRANWITKAEYESLVPKEKRRA